MLLCMCITVKIAVTILRLRVGCGVEVGFGKSKGLFEGVLKSFRRMLEDVGLGRMEMVSQSVLDIKMGSQGGRGAMVR